MPEPVLDKLVQTLLDGTQSGTIEWQEATGDGNSFVARRPSGTITIQRRTDLGGLLGGQIELALRDSAGAAITTLRSAGVADSSSGATTKARQLLPGLFAIVRQGYVGDTDAVRRLIDEFGDPG